MTHEAWRDFQREANRDACPTQPLCWRCGAACSGKTTETVTLDDGVTLEAPTCDGPCDE